MEPDPYPTLNRLQLDGLLGGLDPAKQSELTQLANRCAEIARRRFVEGYDFFDAVTAADAQLAVRMIDGTLADAADIAKAYLDAMASVPKSARQSDSVLTQIRLLASFYGVRGSENDRRCEEALSRIGQELDPASPAMLQMPATANASRLPGVNAVPPLVAEIQGEAAPAPVAPKPTRRKSAETQSRPAQRKPRSSPTKPAPSKARRKGTRK
jgi:hypothetical protein